MSNCRSFTYRYTNVDEKELITRMKRAMNNIVFLKPLLVGPGERVLILLHKIERLILQLS